MGIPWRHVLGAHSSWGESSSTPAFSLCECQIVFWARCLLWYEMSHVSLAKLSQEQQDLGELGSGAGWTGFLPWWGIAPCAGGEWNDSGTCSSWASWHWLCRALLWAINPAQHYLITLCLYWFKARLEQQPLSLIMLCSQFWSPFWLV